MKDDKDEEIEQIKKNVKHKHIIEDKKVCLEDPQHNIPKEVLIKPQKDASSKLQQETSSKPQKKSSSKLQREAANNLQKELLIKNINKEASSMLEKETASKIQKEAESKPAIKRKRCQSPELVTKYVVAPL